MAEINVAALFAAYHGCKVVTKDGFTGKMASVCDEFVKIKAIGSDTFFTYKHPIAECKLVLRDGDSSTIEEEEEESDKIELVIHFTDWCRAHFIDVGYMDIPSLIKDGRYAVEDKSEGGLKS